MSSILDKTWITLRKDNPLFRAGVKTFLEFAKDHIPDKRKIKCPCTKCGNKKISLSYEDVEFHLMKHGFTLTYTVWNLHGEVGTPHEPDFEMEFHDLENDSNINNFEDRFTKPRDEDASHKSDEINQDNMNPQDESGEKTKDFASELESIEEYLTDLYPGCENFSTGSFITELYDLKVDGRWSDSSFTRLLQLLKSAFPPENKLPLDTYHASKVMENVSLGYEKIHACRNDCILYWEKYAEAQQCPICKEPRYILEKTSKSNKVPAKILRYFPITPRLKRMYSVPWVAKEMTWHSTGRMAAGKMGHPVDSSVWKSLDHQYKDFSGEPRNVRLGLATDGFNPFGTYRSSYSCWPVMCVAYNLPPHLCMKSEFTMLTLLIEGPKQPGNNIDVYLQPLIKELKELWHQGATMFDASSHTNFNMRAALLWTIHDFPAYGNISGCKTKGQFACPCCGPLTDSLRLIYGMKHVYMGSRRWLSVLDELSRKDTSAGTFNKKVELRRQPIRLSGTKVIEMTAGINVQWGKKKKSRSKDKNNDEDESTCFNKRSIFFELEYWEHINVRHNLDVMHIEKNVCEILIALMLNTKGKTKDDANARRDLKHLKIKKRLWMKNKNGKVIQPPCRFWLTKKEKKIFFQTLRDLRVPIGFSSNWKNLVSDDGLDLKNLKSHDYHILMQHLLPMLLQHAFNDRKEIRRIIRSYCAFFNALCSRVIDVDTLSILEKGMARTMCELEKICPPSIFVVMMHLPIHLAYEARVCGPVYYRWMYPFERLMMTYKRYVTNKAHPEGCIAERYLKEEAILYSKSYRVDGNADFEQVIKNKFNRADQIPLPDNVGNEEGIGGSELIGKSKKFVLSGVEYEQARRWVIKSQPSYSEWERRYEEFLRKLHDSTGKKSSSLNLSREQEFIPWLKQQLETTVSPDPNFVDIINGPKFFAKWYKKHCVNGFLFVTKDFEKTKINQNSGVRTNAQTTFRSSAKDKAPINECVTYYGVLKDIIQLEYREGYKPVLFKCDWVKVTHQGVKWDEEANLRLVNLSSIISSEHVGDEPFILAEHATQVFYSSDPLNSEWHVVIDVPQKVYSEDGSSLLSNQPVITDEHMGPSNNAPIIEDELIFHDSDEEVVIEKQRKRRRLKK